MHLLMFENAELRRVHTRGCKHLLEACGGFSQTEWPLQFTQLCALRNSHVLYLLRLMTACDKRILYYHLSSSP